VTKVGNVLAGHLSRAGVDVDLLLVEAGCRMHDIFKAAALKEDLKPEPQYKYVPTPIEVSFWREMRERFPNTHETLIASKMLQDEFPEFANFIAQIGSVRNPCYVDAGLEIKIIHYADWRVEHDRIISFEDRLEMLRSKYKEGWLQIGISTEAWTKQEKTIEEELFKHLDFCPDDLAQVVADS
jgi:hypothetical protein